MADVTIRALQLDDWEDYRAIRIRAVEMHTGYFLADPEETRNQPESFWKDNLNGDGKCVFGLFDGNKIIGLCGVFTWREDPSGKTGVMAMDFIDPEYRGQGYVDLLYRARIDFAMKHEPWEKLSICHREGNEPSKRAMIKHGFQFQDTCEIDWPDGTRDIEYQYEMDLIVLRGKA